MMVFLRACALVFFWIATTQPGESLAFEQAIFERNEQKYLANHVVETKQAGSELECGLHCIADKSCTSINYKTSGIGKGRCELNDKTVEETSHVDDKIHDPEFNHLAVIERNPPHLDPKSISTQTMTQPTCSVADWSESFKKPGWSKCGKNDLFITGFYRLNPPDNTNDPISLLEQARCCSSTPEFIGQNGTCTTAWRWWYYLERNDTWSVCPAGYFLNGLDISDVYNLRNIQEGHCCKPSNHPDGYGSCYTEDVGESFEREGWTNCSKLGYYITGLYRGFGDWLKNIDKFRCCQMAAVTSPTCSATDWIAEFNEKSSWLFCEWTNFITGFYRLNPPDNTSDPISLLEQARCCSAIPEFRGQDGTCRPTDRGLDRNDTWSVCPAGYFLHGLRIYGGHNLHNIHYGYCCKPRNHPAGYGSCYTEDVGESFEREGWTNCSKLGYYITGIYRGSGDWLKNIDKFRCCQMAAENKEILSSCKELSERNRSVGNGVYQLRNNDFLKDEYQAYCHMTEISGCGSGGWTLVMKIDGNKPYFNYSSPYWTNKKTYAVEDGLEGLTDKQTKLASYWNTPFDKICLGMKVNNVTKWIVINHKASSLFKVIADGATTTTTAGRSSWKSLIAGSSLQNYCNKEGFNLKPQGSFGLRIGLVANNQNHCSSCDSCIGFGVSFEGCFSTHSSITCGNIALCKDSSHYDTDTSISAFGYILVQ